MHVSARTVRYGPPTVALKLTVTASRMRHGIAETSGVCTCDVQAPPRMHEYTSAAGFASPMQHPSATAADPAKHVIQVCMSEPAEAFTRKRTAEAVCGPIV